MNNDIQLINIANQLSRIADALEQSNKMFASEIENEAIENILERK